MATPSYDLTQSIVPFIDPHLALPLLGHLAGTELFNQNDIAKAQYELAKKTSMVDYTSELFEQAYPGQKPNQADLEKQKQEAIATNERLGTEVETVLNVIEDPSVAASLKQDKAQNLQWLEENYKLTADQINALYRYGWFSFSIGNYGEASSYLYHFRILSTDPALTMSSHWGKLASDILQGEWDKALEEVKLLRDQIESTRPNLEKGGHESLISKRTWLLHWSLFVWFNHPQGRENLIELFLSPAYLNTIQTTCNWLLRYLISALLLTRKNVRFYNVYLSPNSPNNAPTSKLSPQVALRDVTKIITAEHDAGRLKADPFVDFVRELYTDFDFEKAQEELKKAQMVASNDFFLQELADDLIENARFLVSEAYCRIHERVDIADLSRRINMTKEEGEKWIVNLIRDTRADAKIDFKENMVHMNQSFPAVYQNVIEKTRGITFRTSALGQAMDRRAHPIPSDGGNAGARGGRGGRGGGRGRGGRGGANSGNRSQQQQQQQQQQGENGAGAVGAATTEVA